ncbi:MAG TPA: DUF4349 domain-containing protein [Caulobacteraceae bacterium]
MKRTVFLMAVSALTLTAACKQSSLTTQPKPPPAASADAGSQATASNAALAASPQAPMLALAYRLGLVVPADQVRPLMDSHQEACERAGPDQCQVLGANATAEADDRATAELTLRATPAWVRVFRTRAEADAKDLGGRIDEAATEGDDLSTQVVDTEAAQSARAAEQRRLAELMARRTNNLQDTLAVEQEITRVQGETDQAASELAAMKTRIVMQTVTVSYASPAAASPKGASAPLQAAERGFMGNVYGVLAALLSLASVLLPFALLGAPIAWLVARARKKAPAAQKTAG